MVANEYRKGKVLSLKGVRDFRFSYKQFIALILIAALAFTLYLGLASNYRSFSNRVNKMYKDGKVADLVVTTTGMEKKDTEDLRNIAKEGFKKEVDDNDIDFRLFFKTLVTSKNQQTDKNGHTMTLGFATNHNVYLSNKPINQMNISGAKTVYDPFKKPLDQVGEGVFLSYNYFNKMYIGTEFEINVLKSTLINIVKQRGVFWDENGYVYRKEADGTITTIIGEKELGLLDQIESYIKIDERKNIQPGKKNIISREKYLEFFRKITSDKGYLNIPVKLAGYVMQPESVQKNEQSGFLFADFKYLVKQLKKTLSERSEEEKVLVSFLLYVCDVIVNNVETEKLTIDNIDTFETGFMASKTFKGLTSLNEYNYFLDLNKVYTVAFIKAFKTLATNNVNGETKEALQNKLFLLDEKIKTIREDKIYNQAIFKNQTKDKRAIDRIKDLVTKKYDKDTRLIFNTKLSESFTNLTLETDVRQARQLNYVFPMIFFIVAVLVIITTTSQMILRERTQIGTMKAIGYSNKTIYVYYMQMILFLISIGFVIGMIVGPLLIPHIVNEKYKNLYNLPNHTYSFPYIEVIASFLIVILIVGVTTYLVCRRELKLLPAISMRPVAPKINIKVKTKAKKNIPLRMAFRNIRINIVRSILTIIGVMGCGALLLTGMGINDTINYGIDHDMSRFYNNADLAVVMQPNRPDTFSKLKNLNEVKVIENYYNQQTIITNEETGESCDGSTFGFHKNSNFYKPKKGEVFGNGKVLVHEKFAKRLNLHIGDRVSFTMGDKKYVFEVGSIKEAFFVQGVVFYTDEIENFDQVATGALMELKKGTDIDKLAKRVLQIDGINLALTNQDTIKILNKVNTILAIISTTIFVFALLLAVVVLYNLARLNLNERVREIATLKVLGFNRREISRSIFIEMFFLAFVGIVLGLLMGYPMLVSVLITNKMEAVSYIYHINIISFVIAFAIMIGMTLIINFYIAHKSNKVKMIESLKSIE